MRPPARGVSSTARLGARARAAHEPRSTRSRCTARRAGSERAPVAGQAEGLLRRRARRRQDLRHARGRAGRARRGRRCRRRGGGDARSRRDAVAARRAAAAGGAAAPARRVPRTALQELDLDGGAARAARACCSSTSWRTPTPRQRGTRSAGRTCVELLDAGIDVCTTLNVQHLESLNDVVAQITGVRRARDRPRRRARARRRGRAGRSPARRAARAAGARARSTCPTRPSARRRTSSSRGNLIALRELALRRTAERVDADVLAWRREHGISATWPVAEHVLVCVRAEPGLRRPGACWAPHGHRLARPSDGSDSGDAAERAAVEGGAAGSTATFAWPRTSAPRWWCSPVSGRRTPSWSMRAATT